MPVWVRSGLQAMALRQRYIIPISGDCLANIEVETSSTHRMLRWPGLQMKELNERKNKIPENLHGAAASVKATAGGGVGKV